MHNKVADDHNLEGSYSVLLLWLRATATHQAAESESTQIDRWIDHTTDETTMSHTHTTLCKGMPRGRNLGNILVEGKQKEETSKRLHQTSSVLGL
jgi:hypothetical protein